MIMAAPNANRIPKGSIFSTAMYATTNGIRVPRSPKAPAHSIRSKRLPVMWSDSEGSPVGGNGFIGRMIPVQGLLIAPCGTELLLQRHHRGMHQVESDGDEDQIGKQDEGPAHVV